MKKILAIMGSPRKNGNTQILLSKILEGAKKNNSQTEMVFLRDLKIQECDGCEACYKTNECVKHDDMKSLYSKLLNSDIYILGTPLYWWAPTGLMKTFIDRWLFLTSDCNRLLLKNKSIILVIPFGETEEAAASPTIQMFQKSADHLKIPISNIILAVGVNESGAVNNNHELIQRCYNLGIQITQE